MEERLAEGKDLKSNLLCLQVIEFVRGEFNPSSNPICTPNCPESPAGMLIPLPLPFSLKPAGLTGFAAHAGNDAVHAIAFLPDSHWKPFIRLSPEAHPMLRNRVTLYKRVTIPEGMSCPLMQESSDLSQMVPPIQALRCGPR